MKAHRVLAAIAITAAALASACSQRKEDRSAEVLHWWVSGGESAAVRVLADAYAARGGTWKDDALAANEDATTALNARLLGGNPPDAAQVALGKQVDDYVQHSLLVSLDEAADKSKFLDNIPAFVRRAAVYPDGHLRALPIVARGESWLWYNKAALGAAGVPEPVTWSDFFAALEAVKAKGKVIPLAVGAQPWQLGLTFRLLVATKEGADFYMKVFGELDAQAIKSDALKDAFATFVRLRGFADAGAQNREWNVAAHLMLSGKAAFHFMGDWEKGEISAAGLAPGRDVGCQILGNGDGMRYFIAGADSFVFPDTHSLIRLQAQRLLAETMIDPKVQIAFAAKKGSIPIRTDVDGSSLDPCSQLAMRLMKDTKSVIPTTDFLQSPAALEQEWDLVAQAWADPRMTTADFVTAFLKIADTERALRQRAH